MKDKGEKKMDFAELLKHVGHKIHIAYTFEKGKVTEISIECENHYDKTELIKATKNSKIFNKIEKHGECSAENGLVIVSYGQKGHAPANVAIECEFCNEVIVDYDRDTPEPPKEENTNED